MKDKETAFQKAKRRFMEEPMVPIGESFSQSYSMSHFFFISPFILPYGAGLALVMGVFGRGLKALYIGDSKTSFRMMRYRVLFQGATVVAILYGMYFHHFQQQDKSATVNPRDKRVAVDKRFYLDNAAKWNLDIQQQEHANAEAVDNEGNQGASAESQTSSVQMAAER